MAAPTELFEWAGGERAIRALIDAFYDRVEADEEISRYFPGGVHAEHRDHVSAGGARSSEAPPATPMSSGGTRTWSPATSASASHPRRAAAS